MIADITPFDALEADHQADALAWLGSTTDIYRRIKPATPPKHLVAYALLADPADGSVFLVDHRLSGLWLPAGGHVEPFEDPLVTARREALEELGIDLCLFSDQPSFLTVTQTRGEDSHVDVPLWYVARADRATAFRLDSREFAGGRWWTPAEVAASDPATFDPHLPRFLAKLQRKLSPDVRS